MALTTDDAVRLLETRFGIAPDRPFRDTDALVFRHPDSRRWFALLANVAREAVGLPGDGTVSLANLKADPDTVRRLTDERGFLPAWHMNKTHWVTVVLRGPIDEERFIRLAERSFELTR